MSQRTGSLWSPDIQPNVLSPRDILELQAAALREQTDGLLSAEVRETRDASEGAAYFLLDIVGRLPGTFAHPRLGLIDALVMYRRL